MTNPNKHVTSIAFTCDNQGVLFSVWKVTDYWFQMFNQRSYHQLSILLVLLAYCLLWCLPNHSDFSHPFAQWYVTSCPSEHKTYFCSLLWYSEPAFLVKFQIVLAWRHLLTRRVVNWPSSGNSTTVWTHRPFPMVGIITCECFFLLASLTRLHNMHSQHTLTLENSLRGPH